jgi:hypothetical protein
VGHDIGVSRDVGVEAVEVLVIAFDVVEGSAEPLPAGAEEATQLWLAKPQITWQDDGKDGLAGVPLGMVDLGVDGLEPPLDVADEEDHAGTSAMPVKS